MQPVPITAVLGELHPNQLDGATIALFAAWERRIPLRIRQQARPMHLTRGALIVHVKNSVWKSELEFLREELLTTLQQTSPQSRLQSLVFRVAPLPEPSRHRTSEHRPTTTAEPLCFPLEQLARLPAELAQSLAQIANDDLRQALLIAALNWTIQEAE